MLALLLITCLFVAPLKAAYPANFHNQTGCLYAYMDDGRYHITFPDAESQDGTLSKIQYEDKKSNCTNGIYPGNLFVNFATADNNMESLKVLFYIKPSPNNGYWEVTNATLYISPVNKDLFPNDIIELKAVDIYAGQSFSYSCNTFVLQNLHPAKDGAQFKLTLKRFQLQPFAELPNMVFAPSYDCSVWLTLPLLTGLGLVLFLGFTVMIGVYLLNEQGNQTGDLKFSKQGGMLLNQAQMGATKG